MTLSTLEFTIYVSTLIAVVLVWIKTGISPFIWLSRFFIHCESVRVQTIRSAYFAYKHFARAYRGCVSEVKQEAAK